jgi:hypothetical protein
VALLHGSTPPRNTAYPRRISGGAFEIGPAKFGHAVKNTEANPGLGFLIFERTRLELRPDDGFPTTHQGFTSAALIVARCLLPGHPTVRSYIGNMAITNARVPDGLGAQNCVLGWWDRDFDH